MRKNYLKVLFTGLLCLLTMQGVMAQYSFLNDYISTEWSTVEGLPANAINDVIQTADGYIYLGTYEGLVRFNGFEFTLLNKHSGSEYSFISARAMIQDSQGNLWLGSNGEGLQKTSPDGSKTIYTMENGLPNNSIRAMTEDKLGNVWIGTASGVCYITPEDAVILPKAADNAPIGNSLVEELFCDSAGRIWICTTDARGLFYYSDNIFHRYQELDHLGTFFATAISQDNFGTFDEHFAPLMGTCDMDAVIQALLKIGYDGYFTFESERILNTAGGWPHRRAENPNLTHRRIANPNLALRREAEKLLYQIGKFMLESYDCFED